MGLGIVGIVNRYTRGAVIEWVDPSQEKAMENTSSLLTKAVKYLYGLVVSNSITPDVKKSETHRFKSEVTDTTMEDGSVIAEHVIQHPISVTIAFEMTNNAPLGAWIQNISSFLGYNTTFDKLYEIWEKKIECTIITEHKKYTNMVIENLPIVHQAPYKGAYQVMCDFKQLKKKKLSYMSLAKELKTAKSAMKTLQAGLQTLKDK